jgi:hypothetical protein
MATTELIGVDQDKSDDPALAVCYARGAVFKREGNFLRVEKGMRTRVSRALCITGHFEKRCESCPNYEATLTIRVRTERD